MKDVLIITNYYPPETGAASNRINHLAEGLSNQGFKVRVLTPLPNYPTGKIFKAYKGRIENPTVENNVTIHRLWIYANNSKNKLLRLLAMLSYSFSLVWFFMWNRIPKTVIVQSPPLLVAFTAVLFLRSKRRKLILNVSDLWPIAGLELGAFKKNWSYKLLENIERFNYKNANLVLGQSNEILTHVTSLYPEKEVFLYRNFPKIGISPLQEPDDTQQELKIVYAGLLGIAQGIYKLIQELELKDVEFHIYGNGAERALIERYISETPEKTIIYHGEVSRQELHKVLTNYDATIIPLLNRIYGSVPSKIFEYAYLGLPMIYFGGGEGENIITENNLGWVADVGNYKALNDLIATLERGKLSNSFRYEIQNTAQNKFNFDRQLKEFSAMV
ncbi:glycosyltransferase [Winogradskyella sp. 3972H.M.0a.05]|uniref:glycosyltransferase family 4 protein n=1 Tax=Winogradskyella sp. 3972H.M.0a.05 TaxID=2950277 RepID=UPI00339AFBF3